MRNDVREPVHLQPPPISPRDLDPETACRQLEAELETLPQGENSFACGNRGDFWVCCVCGCHVHASCFDVSDYVPLYSRGGIHFFICMRCLRSCAPSLRAASRLLLNETCLLCGHSRGYLVYTTDGYLVHKRCGLLLRGSIYHLQGSVFSAKTGVSAPQRTFIQFVLPPRKCWGIEDLGSHPCSVCGSSAGSGVHCSVMGCTQMVHLGCLDRRSFVYFSSPQGLTLLCPSHRPRGFVPDADTHVLIPAVYASPATRLLGIFRRLREFRQVWARYVPAGETQLREAKAAQDSLRQQMAQLLRRKSDPPRLQRHHLLVDRLALTPWVLSETGVSAIQEVLALTTAAVTPPPPPLTPAVKPGSREVPREVPREEEAWEGSSEDSRGEETRVCVSERDMLVRAAGRHPVYVNLTRLQQLLQRAGDVLERDPFFQFVGSLPSHRFVTGNEYERAVAAAHHMVKRPASPPEMPETPEFPAGNDLWERVDETPLYPTFPLWRAKQGPAELPASPPLSRGSLPVDDVLFSREVTKFDGISARRLTLQAQASPLEKLFSRLIAARPRADLSARVVKSLRSPLATRARRLALLGDKTARLRALRSFAAVSLLRQWVRAPWSLLATPLQLDPWVRDLPQHLPEQLHNDARRFDQLVAALRSIPDTLDAFPRGCERVRRQVDETVLTHLGTESGVCAICASTAFSDITPTCAGGSFICGSCVFNAGWLLIGLYLDVFLAEHWVTCEVVAFDPVSHLHCVLDGDYRPAAVDLADTPYVLRSSVDVLFEASFRRPKTVEDMEADCLVRSSVAAAAQDHRCQVCKRDDNEKELLLCDSCNKAYHVSCLHWKEQSVPDVRLVTLPDL
ncbi:hypothetical protein WA588_001921 [Blastocystis sp. NMH]